MNIEIQNTQKKTADKKNITKPKTKLSSSSSTAPLTLQPSSTLQPPSLQLKKKQCKRSKSSQLDNCDEVETVTTRKLETVIFSACQR